MDAAAGSTKRRRVTKGKSNWLSCIQCRSVSPGVAGSSQSTHAVKGTIYSPRVAHTDLGNAWIDLDECDVMETLSSLARAV